VVKVITCFDVPDRPFPTAGHPGRPTRIIRTLPIDCCSTALCVIMATTSRRHRGGRSRGEQGLRALKVEYKSTPLFWMCRKHEGRRAAVARAFPEQYPRSHELRGRQF
jgi:hypothetical protein